MMKKSNLVLWVLGFFLGKLSKIALLDQFDWHIDLFFIFHNFRPPCDGFDLSWLDYPLSLHHVSRFPSTQQQTIFSPSWFHRVSRQLTALIVWLRLHFFRAIFWLSCRDHFFRVRPAVVVGGGKIRRLGCFIGIRRGAGRSWLPVAWLRILS